VEDPRSLAEVATVRRLPVEFLTDEQAEVYGKFTEEPTMPELERFFFLDDEDRKLIAKRRGDHNRLGFAPRTATTHSRTTFRAGGSARSCTAGRARRGAEGII
jgi:hypothetical protein